MIEVLAQDQTDCSPASRDLSAFSNVFAGTLSSVRPECLEFRVHRVWKGDLAETIAVPEWLAARIADTPLREGEEYLVYLPGPLEEAQPVGCSRARFPSEANESIHVYPVAQSPRLQPANCNPTRLLAEAADDLELLGEGIATSFADSVQSTPSEIEPHLLTRSSAIRFPPGYRVRVTAQGREGYTAVVFGYLPPAAKIVDGFDRVAPRDRRIYGAFKSGDTATIETSEVLNHHLDLDIDFVRVQEGQFKQLRDDGETGAGLLSWSEVPEKPSAVVLSHLPQDFEFTIDWEAIVAASDEHPGVCELSLFRHVCRIGPRISTYSDVVEVLGEPGRIEGRESPFRLLYPDSGIVVWIEDALLRPTSKVASIAVEDPFQGTSSEGIRIGLLYEEALAILEKEYMVELADEQWIVAVQKGSDASTALTISAGVVSSISIW